jgi:glycosidase
LENEYPRITIFGEAWVNSPVANAYFTRNNLNIPFNHNANSIIDFQLCFAMLDAASGSADRVYNTLAQDIVYKDPIRNCIFLDNHDMDRAFSRLNEEWNKLRLGLTWLLTLRGIPWTVHLCAKTFREGGQQIKQISSPGRGDRTKKIQHSITQASSQGFDYHPQR